MRTLLDFENAILDLFERNKITVDGAKTVLWQLLTALYEDELIEEPHRRETVIENIEKHRKSSSLSIFWRQDEMENQIWMSLLMLAIVLSPVIWGQQYPWPCDKCHNKYCFEKCNKAYLMMNGGGGMWDDYSFQYFTIS